jgi:rod shape determining protein RodA
MMTDRPRTAARHELQSPIRHVDWSIPALAVGIAVFGGFMNYSSTWRFLDFNGGDPYFFARRQAVFIAVGILVMIVAAAVDYRVIRDFAPQLYLLSTMSLG